jgi:hypothetical protein
MITPIPGVNAMAISSDKLLKNNYLNNIYQLHETKKTQENECSSLTSVFKHSQFQDAGTE